MIFTPRITTSIQMKKASIMLKCRPATATRKSRSIAIRMIRLEISGGQCGGNGQRKAEAQEFVDLLMGQKTDPGQKMQVFNGDQDTVHIACAVRDRTMMASRAREKMRFFIQNHLLSVFLLNKQVRR